MFVQSTKGVAVSDSLDLAPYCSTAVKQQGHQAAYKLTAVCDHYGNSFTEGHYTAQCWSSSNSKWYCCNDSSIRCMEGGIVDAPSSSAYMLMYRRQDG